MARFSMGLFGPYLSEEEYDELHGLGAARQRIKDKQSQATVIAIIGVVVLVAALLIVVPTIWDAIFDPHQFYQ